MTAASPAARVLVVGAGPAGIRAAQMLAGAGLHPVVVDEAARAGGQIYRRPPQGFARPATALYGSEARKARALHDVFDALVAAGRVTHLARHTVVGVDSCQLSVVPPGGGLLRLPFDRLLLAGGASDRVAPVPGWQAAGVYALGAAQIALKAQGVALGRQIVLAGSGPLLTLVGAQLLAAGAGLRAVLDTSAMRGQLRALPDLAARPLVALRGLGLRARLGRLYRPGVRLLGIASDASGVTGIDWQDARGRSQHTPCDTVALGWHLRSETHLADLAGCEFDHDALWQQWLPRADAMGRAGTGLYLAGDGLRPLGADAAEISGRLAAGACLADLGLPAPDPAPDLARLARLARFARGIGRGFPWPGDSLGALPDATVICRCEGITAAELRATAAGMGPEINRIKSLSRLGMGRCQGRFCHLAGAGVIAAAQGCIPAAVGRLRGQAPTRPVTAAAFLPPAGDDPAPGGGA